MDDIADALQKKVYAKAIKTALIIPVIMPFIFSMIFRNSFHVIVDKDESIILDMDAKALEINKIYIGICILM